MEALPFRACGRKLAGRMATQIGIEIIWSNVERLREKWLREIEEATGLWLAHRHIPFAASSSDVERGVTAQIRVSGATTFRADRGPCPLLFGEILDLRERELARFKAVILIPVHALTPAVRSQEEWTWRFGAN